MYHLLLLLLLLLLLHKLLLLLFHELLLLLLLLLHELLLLLFQELLLPNLLDEVSWDLRGPLGDLSQWVAIPRWATVSAFVRQVPHLAAVFARCGSAVIGACLGGVVMSSADGAVPVVAHRCGAW